MSSTSISMQANGEEGDRFLDAERVNIAFDSILKTGAEYADIRVVSNTSNRIEYREQTLHQAVPGQDLGATLRVRVNGDWGSWSTNRPHELLDKMAELVSMAKNVSRGKNRSEITPLSEIPILSDEHHIPSTSDPRSVSIEDRVTFLDEVSMHLSSLSNLKSLTVQLRDDYHHNELLTSEGTDLCWSAQRAVVIASMVGATENRRVSLRGRRGGTGGLSELFATNLDVWQEQASESMNDLLKGTSPPHGRMPLVMNPELTGVFTHEAVGHSCEADLVTSNDSILAGKIGEKIAADGIKVFDDPTIEGAFGSFHYDDEGVKTDGRVLIEDGILVNYLNDRQTAGKLGVESNGAARAQDGLHTPLVRMSNTILSGGRELEEEELFEGIVKGVYASGSKGGQVDTARGSFQFSPQQSWLIENGELSRPLNDVSFSGMTLDILAAIEGQVPDPNAETHCGFCGKGQTAPVGDGGPFLRISESLIG